MLYKKNTTSSLSEELFKNPTSEYRGTPFWAWNNLLTKEELCRQIDVFKEIKTLGLLDKQELEFFEISNYLETTNYKINNNRNLKVHIGHFLVNVF